MSERRTRANKRNEWFLLPRCFFLARFCYCVRVCVLSEVKWRKIKQRNANFHSHLPKYCTIIIFHTSQFTGVELWSRASNQSIPKSNRIEYKRFLHSFHVIKIWIEMRWVIMVIKHTNTHTVEKKTRKQQYLRPLILQRWMNKTHRARIRCSIQSEKKRRRKKRHRSCDTWFVNKTIYRNDEGTWNECAFFTRKMRNTRSTDRPSDRLCCIHNQMIWLYASQRLQ